MKGIIIGGINIIEKNSEVLLIKEKGNIVAGKWNLPGGTLNINEDIVSCAKREAREETGFEIKPSFLVGIYNQILSKHKSTIVSFVFKSDILGGKLILSEDVEDIQWFSVEAIENFDQESLLAFPYVLKSIHDYRAGRRMALDYINTFY